MLRCRKFMIGVICFSIIASVISSYAEVERYVAVVITSSRAFGLAAETSAFNEIPLRKNETLEKLKLTYSKATVHTSERLLTFESSATTWKEHKLY